MPENESTSPTCSLSFFDCLTPKNSIQNAHKRASRRIGVERQMHVTYNQPHLVEPMKLTVYDALPATPIQASHSQVSQIMTQGRKAMSRASTRASLHHRKKSSTRLLISKPSATQHPQVQLRRNPSYRPLQLSIYVEGHRLSDLPIFDRLSFNDDGAIKIPPRAVVRTQSEELLRTVHTAGMEVPSLVAAKPASMFEQTMSRRMSVVSHMRKETASSAISTSRPASAYDALNSHPVSWFAAPAVPPQAHLSAAPNSVAILSPMQEEFTPPPSGAVIIDGTVLAFPNVDAHRVPTEESHATLLPPAAGQRDAAPSPVVDPGPNRRATLIQHKSQKSQTGSINAMHRPGNEAFKVETRPYFHTNYATNARINDWLTEKVVEKEMHTARSRESSISTIKSSSTTSSFAEHRRKRSEFYQLNKTLNKAAAPAAAKPITAPTPLSVYKVFPTAITAIQNPVAASMHKTEPSEASATSHSRNDTVSTIASTIATDVLFEDAESPRRDVDAISMTTYTCDENGMKSRTGTLKSNATHKTTTTEPPSYAESEQHANTKHGSSPPTEAVPIPTLAAGSHFDFTRQPSPQPFSHMPLTPTSQAADVEKYMHEICGQRGLRRVNVGVAF